LNAPYGPVAAAIWVDPNFAPLQAENLTGLKAERSHFALVKAKSCRCAKVGPPYMSTLGGAGHGISPSSFSGALERPLQRRAFSRNSMKTAAFACGMDEQRRSPIIMAEAPEQIEVAE
jgi:hypothetical protein